MHLSPGDPRPSPIRFIVQELWATESPSNRASWGSVWPNSPYTKRRVVRPPPCVTPRWSRNGMSAVRTPVQDTAEGKHLAARPRPRATSLPWCAACAFRERPTWPLPGSPGRNSLVRCPLWPLALPLAQLPCGPTGGRCGVCPSSGRTALTTHFLSTLLPAPGEWRVGLSHPRLFRPGLWFLWRRNSLENTKRCPSILFCLFQEPVTTQGTQVTCNYYICRLCGLLITVLRAQHIYCSCSQMALTSGP